MRHICTEHCTLSGKSRLIVLFLLLILFCAVVSAQGEDASSGNSDQTDVTTPSDYDPDEAETQQTVDDSDFILEVGPIPVTKYKSIKVYYDHSEGNRVEFSCDDPDINWVRDGDKVLLEEHARLKFDIYAGEGYYIDDVWTGKVKGGIPIAQCHLFCAVSPDRKHGSGVIGVIDEKEVETMIVWFSRDKSVEITHQVIIPEFSGGSVGTEDGRSRYKAGDTVSLLVHPDPDYFLSSLSYTPNVQGIRFVTFIVDPDREPYGAYGKFEMPDKDVTISAHFKMDDSKRKKHYNVTVECEPAGAAKMYGSGCYGIGIYAPVMVSYYDHYCYRFDHWTMNGEIMENCTDTWYFDYKGPDDCTFTAHFEPISETYSVIVESVPAGVATVSGTGEYSRRKGQCPAIEIEDYDKRYVFKNWSYNDQIIEEDNPKPYFFYEGMTDCIIKAHFELDAYTVTVESEPAGIATISGGGDYSRRKNETPTIAIQEHNNRYLLKYWSVNGQIIEDDSPEPYFIYDGMEDCTIKAHFEEVPADAYIVDVESEPTGLADISGGGVYFYGTDSSVTVKVTDHNPNCRLKYWSVNGQIVDDDNPGLEFVYNGKADCTIKAHFEQNADAYFVTVEAEPADIATMSGGGLYSQITDTAVTAGVQKHHPDYQLQYWSVNGQIIEDDNPGLVFVYDGRVDCTIKAHFLKVTDVEKYPIWVCGEQLTDNHMNGIGWRYEKASNTLILSGADLSIDDPGDYVIYSESHKEPLNIRLEGSNRLSGGYAGLRSLNSLNITGSGSLTCDQCRITSISDLIIKNCSVTILDSECESMGLVLTDGRLTVSNQAGTGILVDEKLIMEGNSSITAEGETPIVYFNRDKSACYRLETIEPIGVVWSKLVDPYYGPNVAFESDGMTKAKKVVITRKLRDIVLDNNTAGGTVTADRISAGFSDPVVLTVNPAEGYNLEKISVVYGEGNLIEPDQDEEDPTKYTFSMPKDQVYVYADFALIPYTVTVDAGENGSVILDREAAGMGEPVTMLLIPAPGYGPDTVTVTDEQNQPIALSCADDGRQLYTFTQPLGNVNVAVTWKTVPCSIIAAATDYGTVTVDKETAMIGETVTVTVETHEYLCHLGKLLIRNGGRDVECTKVNEETYTFRMPGGDVIINAMFCKDRLVYFVNWNGQTLEWYEMQEGDMPVFHGETPEAGITSKKYNFTFAGWDKEIAAVTEDVTYTATYIATTKKHTVTFENSDGTVLKTAEFEYGEEPVYFGDVPQKPGSSETEYEFSGWTPELTAVTTAVTYTAVYAPVPKLEMGENTVRLETDQWVGYPFTPAASGWYRFYSVGRTGSPTVRVYNGNALIASDTSYRGEGFNFDCVVELSAGTTYTVQIIGYAETNLKVYAVNADIYTVAVDTNIAHGSLIWEGSAYAGQQMCIEPVPDEGYDLAELIVIDDDGHSVKTDHTLFTMPNRNVTISARFEKLHPITIHMNDRVQLFRDCVDVNGLMKNSEDATGYEGALVGLNLICCDDNDGIDTVLVTASDGTVIPCHPMKDEIGQIFYRFIMPAQPVTVDIYIKGHMPAFGNADFALPRGTVRIEEEAFSGITAGSVFIPDSCTSVGSYAFENCLNLTRIRVPEHCQLGEDIFYRCRKVYVYGYPGSDAEAYCNDAKHKNCVFVSFE